MQKEVVMIIHKLSIKYDIPKEVVEEILKFKYKTVRKLMNEGNMLNGEGFKNINLPNLGKLSVKPFKIEALSKQDIPVIVYDRVTQITLRLDNMKDCLKWLYDKGCQIKDGKLKVLTLSKLYYYIKKGKPVGRFYVSFEE